MQYTVFVSQIPNQSWRATVPGLPDCVAEASTRKEVLNKIEKRISEVVEHIEVLRIQGPELSKHTNGSSSENSRTPWEWFGKFADDTTWGQLFEQIESERDTNLLGA